MSKAAAFLVLAIAVLSGLFASAAVVKYMQQQKKTETAAAVPMTALVIAKEEIPAGTTIRSEHIDLVERVAEAAPPGAIKNKNEVVGRMVKSAIYKDEVIVEKRLVEPGSAGGLPALIPNKQRAFTVRVDETISVAGFIRPGHYIDIVTTVDIDYDGAGRETISKVILQNIRVIATGKEIERKDENRAKVVPTVTVLVTLEQAERLALASNAGTVLLVLRNHTDKVEETTEGARLTSLIPNVHQGLEPPEPVVFTEIEPLPIEPLPTPIPLKTIVVHRGKTISEVSFKQ